MAKAIRRDAFAWEPFEFIGFFPPQCQSNSVPTSLRSLVSMLLNGPNVNEQRQDLFSRKSSNMDNIPPSQTENGDQDKDKDKDDAEGNNSVLVDVVGTQLRQTKNRGNK
ncbi:hypothetical protein E2C01_014178 [Portunus trituberculatus]|uniref:Uncharacterized protein n=1 Tax=Portunus trituberculatus TaxID=210409 RepID=A0A5B7DI34_PORTR|nr:hypothetical protein [Portunus trituberculatus]